VSQRVEARGCLAWVWHHTRIRHTINGDISVPNASRTSGPVTARENAGGRKGQLGKGPHSVYVHVKLFSAKDCYDCDPSYGAALKASVGEEAKINELDVRR